MTFIGQTYIGIDPGFKGAVAVLRPDDVAVVYDPPILMVGKKRDHDIQGMVAILEPWSREPNVHVAIEKVHSMPQQGVASVFTFGKGYGIWLGVLATLGLPYELVTPQKWQGVMMDGMQRGKDAARAKAMQLYPKLHDKLKRKSDDGRADALLIATWRQRIS